MPLAIKTWIEHKQDKTHSTYYPFTNLTVLSPIVPLRYPTIGTERAYNIYTIQIPTLPLAHIIVTENSSNHKMLDLVG